MGNAARTCWISPYWVRISGNTHCINSCTCSNTRRKCVMCRFNSHNNTAVFTVQTAEIRIDVEIARVNSTHFFTTQWDFLTLTKGQSLNVNLNCHSTSIQSTLLVTALVKVRYTNGRLHTARAIIDPWSQCWFVPEVLLKKLKLLQMNSAASVIGVANAYPVSSKESSILDWYPCHN